MSSQPSEPTPDVLTEKWATPLPSVFSLSTATTSLPAKSAIDAPTPEIAAPADRTSTATLRSQPGFGFVELSSIYAVTPPPAARAPGPEIIAPLTMTSSATHKHTARDHRIV